jgi:rhodanese-related sulfurtransferase
MMKGMRTVAAANSGMPEISRDDLIRAMHDRAITLVDVLSPESFASMHIPGAINLPVADLARPSSPQKFGIENSEFRIRERIPPSEFRLPN